MLAKCTYCSIVVTCSKFQSNFKNTIAMFVFSDTFQYVHNLLSNKLIM